MPNSATADTPLDPQALRSITYWPLGDDVMVAAMSDGYFQTTTGDAVRRLDPEFADRLHGAHGRHLPVRITHMNYAVLAPKAPVTLVDAGMGQEFGDSLGHLPTALRAAGIAPGDVGLILLTHLHLDHAAGLLTGDGGVLFENAAVVVDPAEVAFWTDPRARQRASADLTPWFDRAARIVEAYRGHLVPPSDLPSVTPLRIEPIPLTGHTPGHTGYRLSTSEQSVTFVGDLVHMPAVQGPRPDACMVFDVDPDEAARTRREFLTSAAASADVIAGGHTEYPGFTTVTSIGGGHFDLRPALWADYL